MAPTNDTVPRFHDAQDTDIVIPIIGLGGAGKSTFINYLLQGAKCSEKAVLVGHDQDPCTTQLQYVVLDSSCRPELKDFNGRRLVFVDTPGLDGTDPRGNNQVMGEIVKWFKSSYGARMSFRGVVYLEDISDARHPKLAKSMVERLHEISRDSKMTAEELKERMLLVTTKWSRAAPGARDEKEFEKTEDLLKGHWQPMVDAGAQIQRLEAGNEETSAWQIIRSILEKAEKTIAFSDHESAQASKPKATGSRNWSFEHAGGADIVIIDAQGHGSHWRREEHCKHWSFLNRRSEFASPFIYKFINSFLSFLGDPTRIEVGTDLVSCTDQLEPIVFEGLTDHRKRIKGHRIVVVDTPGFDATYVDDFEILNRISKWLEQSYRTNTVIGGVIYLHDISQGRFSGTAQKNLEIFRRMCGDAFLDRVVLVTSKWGRAVGQNLEKRENELKKNHWKTMLDGGARAERLDANDEEKGTWRIVCSILDKIEGAIEQAKPEGLEIQKELVERHKLVPQTQAGRELRRQLEDVLQAMLKCQADAVSGDGGARAQLEVAEEAQQIAQQIQNMKISLLDRVSRWVKLALKG
ncbi:hypothetical protein EST38_g13803 [Candolleomyces aberdarensis]|uniref:G domain-containing protein n=1 Tax=Candolleomyces aberdarensis TaxID=2316362 RepID=A0A4Q2CYW6_9AGAR|nr:hypothetical protein EST38_g13803 [Candolleomyces aberdarensis]